MRLRRPPSASADFGQKRYSLFLRLLLRRDRSSCIIRAEKLARHTMLSPPIGSAWYIFSSPEQSRFLLPKIFSMLSLSTSIRHLSAAFALAFSSSSTFTARGIAFAQREQTSPWRCPIYLNI